MEERIAMMNRFMILLVASLVLAAPRSALAFPTVSGTFDTVDDVEIQQVTSCGSFCLAHTIVSVTGIPRGQTTPTTQSFDFDIQADLAAHCQRLAMVAMAKPGTYRFGIGTNSGGGACRLTLVSP